jgi:peroxiredoxin (alkyl hydroperoxide reductase subunit C)
MSTEMDAPMTRIDTPMPRILDEAPDFEAKTTQGTIRLSDFTNQGKWVMLFSHPSDFTPVCSTEFLAFARRNGEFEKRNVQLIGLSIDSLYSHIAWVRDIEQRTGVTITFPVIADLNQKVATLYGMVHPTVSDTATVRAVFLIDPKRKIRAILYYPMQLGRNVDELLRMFDGLQMADLNSVSVPCDWKPGEPVIVAAPPTVDAARKRANGEDKGLKVDAWYLSTKDAPSSK